MIHEDFLQPLTFTFLVSSLQGQIARFLWHMAALQLHGMAPRGVARGPAKRGIGQRRGCRAAPMDTQAPASPTGSHLPAEGTAQPFVGAPFRIGASCPASQKPHTLPCPTT